MKTTNLTCARSILLAGSLFFLLPSAQADTDAVTPLVSEVLGYVNGGSGFSFTPTTNLLVTRVGYLDEGNVNPIIKFWAGTNYPMASFTLAPGTSSDAMVYSNVSLTLLAGRPYSITLQEGSSFASVFLLRAYVTNTARFLVATQLAAYQSLIVTTTGVFTNFSTNVLYLGPNFSYSVQTTPITLPLLSISRSNASTTVLTWPAPSSGFLLTEIPSLTQTNWAFVTNPVNVVNTTNRVNVSSPGTNRFYRLFHP